ncbi:FAD-binding oxidoreductase [Microbacterium caowuchunii]|uniref:FAD-binding oxidoreductase n=1 Tax=Microbacterium caowuchunii TaxID=2614638 RepID=A0A5N0TIV9_9MICO|nr:FAD-binding oxidoreductase [Microbacterium caowuchunii]KAA9134438.1 FAD-binding oxidoreductase [Microbacterium caowuchunii]
MTPSDSASPGPGAAPSGERIERLGEQLAGRLVLPGDPDWDDARGAWQLLADQQPAAVVIAAGEQDVIATVVAARRLDLAVAPQGTGHAGGTIPSMRDTILLRTGALDTIDIDPETERVRVGAGAVWSDVVEAAAGYGLAAVAGMSPSVGVAGFSLGGGLGWLARSHGLAANSIRSLDVVDARGRPLRVDHARHADLFWAARGGVAPVVVTALELQLYPIDRVRAGGLLWPLERAREIAHAWREWIGSVPDTVTSLVRVLRYPPIPEIPEPLRGRAFVGVEVAIQGDADSAAALLEPLRDLAPEIDSVRTMSPAKLATVHGDPEQPSPAYGESTVVREITAETVDALVDAALAPSSDALLSIELRHLGGMLTPGRADGGAVSSIPGAGVVYAVGIVPSPEAERPVRAAASAVTGRIAPYASAVGVKNFSDDPQPAEELYGEATERLRATAEHWDPERRIRIGHPLDGPRSGAAPGAESSTRPEMLD